jgi:Cd2+/Zn2+-exporting ATPase
MSRASAPGDSAEAAPTASAATPASSSRDRRAIALLIGAGAALGAGVLAADAGASAAAIGAWLLSIALTIPQPARRAWAALGRRTLDINALMIVAVIGAAALGEWLEAAAVVWLFGLAGWLEARSHSRARQAIRALVAVTPGTAVVRTHRGDEEVGADTVRPGTIVVLKPGARAPVDGLVVSGSSTMDQAPVTGESWPVEKTAGDEVFAGSINGAGALEVEALRPAADSTLARIVRLVEQAQRERAPIQTFVDRFAARYTPAVVLLAILIAVVPPLAGGWSGGTRDFAVWGYRALALLVVACPCALVISTPVSVVSALATAARHGVLVKGGAHLERLGSVKCVAFDKTGTLTHGRVSVTDILGLDGMSEDGVLSVAAALESRSEHPIGRAIVDHARRAGLDVLPGLGFRALPGLGAEAVVAAAPAVVGSHRLFEERQLCTPSLHARLDELQGRGATAVLVGHAGSPVGVIALSDEVRPDGRSVVASLREQGVTHLVLLTGDTRANADAVRDGADLDEAHAELLPHDKVRHLSQLRETHGPIAMVGDGVNDAPALASADVGIAMGAAGTDVALETADVALMSDDLSKLPYALRLARATLRNIRQNVALALGLKLAFVGLAAFGIATIWMAVLADTGATLLVTGNALRLLKVRP